MVPSPGHAKGKPRGWCCCRVVEGYHSSQSEELAGAQDAWELVAAVVTIMVPAMFMWVHNVKLEVRKVISRKERCGYTWVSAA